MLATMKNFLLRGPNVKVEISRFLLRGPNVKVEISR